MDSTTFLFTIFITIQISVLIYFTNEQIDRWLCIKAPWFIRLWWSALWIRKDPFHPSLDSDGDALLKKINFCKTALRVFLDITGSRPSRTKRIIIRARLRNLEKRIKKEYYNSLDSRQKHAGSSAS